MADTETITMNLENEITINGRRFAAGQKVIVPKAQAEDLERMDHDYEKLKKGYHEKHVNIHNAGTFAVGSGAN